MIALDAGAFIAMCKREKGAFEMRRLLDAHRKEISFTRSTRWKFSMASSGIMGVIKPNEYGKLPTEAAS